MRPPSIIQIGTVFFLSFFNNQIYAADNSPSVRAAQREQALAQLDDPSPIVRITVFEEVLNGTDTTLKTLAARKALTSTDRGLRDKALKYAFSMVGQKYDFIINKCELRNGATQDLCQSRFGIPIISFYFDSMNQETGQFNVHTSRDPGTKRAGRIMNGEANFEYYGFGGGANCGAKLDKILGTALTGNLYCDDGLVTAQGSMSLF
jgi:hypothetical protein